MNNPQPFTIRLVVVARRLLDGDALAALFRAHAEFHILCTTTSTKVATLFGKNRQPDAVILNGMYLDQEIDQGIDSLVERMGCASIVVLDDELNRTRLAAVLSLPNVGYFTRSTPFTGLAEGIRRLVRGERAFDPIAGRLIYHTPHGLQFRQEQKLSQLATLTPGEVQILKLIAQGHTVKHCAQLLSLAPSTVDNHKSRLMKKLGIHKSLDLTRLAIREGLVHT